MKIDDKTLLEWQECFETPCNSGLRHAAEFLKKVEDLVEHIEVHANEDNEENPMETRTHLYQAVIAYLSAQKYKVVGDLK